MVKLKYNVNYKMIRQSERKEVMLLLSQHDRRDLRRYIGKCWESLEVEDEMKSPELCVDKLLSLYPEKKIYANNKNVPETDEELIQMLCD